MRWLERHLLQSLSRQERLPGAVKQGLVCKINECPGVIQDEQRLPLPQVERALFQGLEHALQGWISEVAKLDERRTLLGGCSEVHDQRVGESGIRQGDTASANGKPTAEEYEACGTHNVLPLCCLLAVAGEGERLLRRPWLPLTLC